MGWWEAPEDKKIVVGDDVLDMVRHFLKDFSNSYQNSLSRKPSVDELQYMLNLGFSVNADDEILSDFEEKEIKQVNIKVAKRAKRQKAKQGDIFCFKIDDKRFGFGRIVSEVMLGWVAEIFDYFSDKPVFDYNKLGKWLIDPIILDCYTLFELKLEGDWKIIGSNPGFNPGEEFKNVRFVTGDGLGGNLWSVDIFDNKTRITKEESKGLRRFSACGNYDVLQLVSEALKNR
ncbi:MAG TPA: Imm26 family immunity protein [Spirochaetota bacterium]|nr:Imm26 family immunity protein [Spirochaetota bacterium]